MKKYLLYAVAPLLLLCDILLKGFVISHMGNMSSNLHSYHLSLLSFIEFHLTYVENTGMAWGMFSSFQSVILFFRVILIAAMFYGLWKSKSMQRNTFGFLLLSFGALGNVIDTFVYGYVIDMLHFTFWGRSYGVFNIADAMIFLGAICIILSKKRKYAVEK